MNGTNYEVPHCGAFSTPHSHPTMLMQLIKTNFHSRLHKNKVFMSKFYLKRAFTVQMLEVLAVRRGINYGNEDTEDPKL